MRVAAQATAQWSHRCAEGWLATRRPLMSEGASQATRRPPCPLDTDDEQSVSEHSEDLEELQLLTDNLQRSTGLHLSKQRRVGPARLCASAAQWCRANSHVLRSHFCIMQDRSHQGARCICRADETASSGARAGAQEFGSTDLLKLS